ncbi:MAG: class I SAM-dependent methyltransferase [Rhodospirillales bacterium]|nr:class I SAM-dependent methyltransferase [Alphaproteobacteria bacterium]MCB1840787.1 class I SAM-dependent methyltransferase [Alphaproteobacteria bacterium]MCB9976530.1 class I SAM-dependent methyltransferase [Rhodospirillales bacterium]
MQLSLRRRITGALPQPVRYGLRRIIYRGHALTCPLCEAQVSTYISHGADFEVLYRRKVVGGMIREHDQCPACRSADRTRLMMLYLKNVSGVGVKPLRILHIAPDFGLYLWFKRHRNVDYVASDLDLARYRHIENIQKADITAMPFKDNDFDIVICSHVLEHIPDDRKAMSEILRVLKPSGKAMLMVPLATDGQGTEEDPSINDPREQEQRFGQWDHVRLYGKDDFISRLSGAGFTVKPFNGYDLFPEEAKDLLLNPQETLVVCEKSNA